MRTFEDVAVLQLLSVRTLSKTFLQSLKSFRAQRVLAGWTSGGDGPRGFSGGGSGGVGGGYERFVVSTPGGSGRAVRTHGWVESDLVGWVGDNQMTVIIHKMNPAIGAESLRIWNPRDHAYNQGTASGTAKNKEPR
jgi:hypothetical protein